MICDRCGRDNPESLAFCQDCGRRLASAGHIVPPTPPTGLGVVPVPPSPPMPDNNYGARTAQPVAPRPEAPPLDLGSRQERVACARCKTPNPFGYRFCVTCGTRLSEPPVPIRPTAVTGQAGAVAAAQVGDLVASALREGAAIRDPVASEGQQGSQEPQAGQVICTRCNGASDASMLYCMYCGASLESAVHPADATAHQRLEQRLIARGELEPVAMGREAQQRFALAATQGPASSARLVTIAKDGAEGTSYFLTGPQIDIGREEGTILLREDPYISPRHIRISRKDGGFFARNLDSLNGFFLRLRGVRTLEHADLLLVGLQVLRFEVVKDGQEGFGPAARETTLLFGSPMLPRYARLTERTVEGVPRSVFYLHREETILGREAGDIVFTDDPFMSRRHLSIRFDPKTREFTALDLNSSNGTYLAARGEVRLADGDHLRMGQHLFRFEDPEQRQGAPVDGARRSP